MGSNATERIEALLPHRPPFLFVDEIVEEGEGRIVTEWRVPDDLPAFEGHFPGEPVLPGVLMSEFAFQSGALLIYGGSEEDREAAGVPVLVRIEDARFKKIVRPGESLRAEITLDERLGNARYMRGKITSGGKLVVRLKFVLAVAEGAS